MRKKFTYINLIEYYLPKKKEKNSEIINPREDKSKKIINKIGINSRSIAGENETSTDLAIMAAKKIKKLDLQNLDFLIFCTQTPDYIIPTNACIIQNKLSLSNHMGSIDIIQGCSGYNYSISYAQGLIESGQAGKVLIINSDVYSKFTSKKNYKTRVLFGDGSAATLLSNKKTEESFQIIKNEMGTDGSGYDDLILENLGVKNYHKNLKQGDHIKMNGARIFQFAMQKVPSAIKRFLSNEKILLSKIDYFVFHQANKFILESLQKKMVIPKEKMIISMKNTGNTVSSSIPIALKEYEKKIKKGSLILLIGFGVGLSWGITLIRKI